MSSSRFTRERSQVRNPPRPSSESPAAAGLSSFSGSTSRIGSEGSAGPLGSSSGGPARRPQPGLVLPLAFALELLEPLAQGGVAPWPELVLPAPFERGDHSAGGVEVRQGLG